MKVAVLGAGLAGLAVTYFLTQQHTEVTVFDPIPLAQGTSGIAAGILNPYAGAHAKLNWMGVEGVEATLALLKIAEKFLGESVILSQGVLRPVLTAQQEKNFRIASQKYPEMQWWTPQQSASAVAGLEPIDSLFIPQTWSIDCEAYLKGLWLACQKQGAVLIPETIVHLSELDRFDKIFICAGAQTSLVQGLPPLQLSYVKGQILTLEWPEKLPPLPLSLSSKKYLCMKKSTQHCFAGATYERDFVDARPDIQKAKEDIFSDILHYFPAIAQATILDCRAGVRVSTPDKHPLLVTIDQRTTLFTGLGSKGLLYHALFGKRAVNLAYSCIG